jgi:hypothetical protein
MSVIFTKRCARCGVKTDTTIMSKFNEDILCLDCEDVERRHPKYPEAVRAEAEAVRDGDDFFPGIGKPVDL